MTLQNTTNLLLSHLLKGVETQIQSSDIATNKSNDSVYLNNSHDCIARAVSIVSEAYYAHLRYVIQYIYHNMVKLFRFIGRHEEYNSYFGSKYSWLGSVLVSNRPDIFWKTKTEEVTNHVN